MLSRKLQSSSVASLSPEEVRVKDMLTQSASIKNQVFGQMIRVKNEVYEKREMMI
jgi:hypothetical protein